MPKRKLSCNDVNAHATRRNKHSAPVKKQSTKKYITGKTLGRTLQRRDRILQKIEEQGACKKWTDAMANLDKKIKMQQRKFKKEITVADVCAHLLLL